MQIMNSAGEYLMMGGEKEEREEKEEETLLEALEMATEIRKATKGRTKVRPHSCIVHLCASLGFWKDDLSTHSSNDIVTNILHHSCYRLPSPC